MPSSLNNVVRGLRVMVPGPDGALGFTVIEMREHNEVTASRGRTTALVVKRPGPSERNAMTALSAFA